MNVFSVPLNPSMKVQSFLSAQQEHIFNCNFRDFERKRNIALVIQYDGSFFAGWQRQANAPSIQESIEQALSQICQEDILLYGCSRTDAGVHALAYVASFYTNCQIPITNLPLACRSLLPSTISVLQAFEVAHTFNARFSTLAKSYTYDVVLSKIEPALLSRTFTQCYYPINIELVQAAADLLVGEHDFRAFCGAKSEVKTYVRRVLDIEIFLANTGYPAQLNCLRMRVSGDGFLYNMVRIIAGTLLFAGANKLSLDSIQEALVNGNRKLAGPTLEARGLTLERVYYCRDLDKLSVQSNNR